MNSIEELERKVERCRSEGDAVVLAGALRSAGEAHRQAGNEPRALGLYEESVKIYRETDADLKLAHTIRHLGMIHEGAGRNGEALKCYDEALGIYRAAQDPGKLDLANAVRALAFLKSKIDDEGASELWKEARSIYEKLGLDEGVAEADSFLR